MAPVSVPSYSSESGKVRTRTFVVGSLAVLLVFLAVVLFSDPSLALTTLGNVMAGPARFVGMYLAPFFAVGSFIGVSMFRAIARNEADAAMTLPLPIKILWVAGIGFTLWIVAVWFIF